MSEKKQDDYRELARICRTWWQGLNARGDGGTQDSRNREALAKLRRIGVADAEGTSIVDVGYALGVPAFQDLLTRILRAEVSKRVKGWLGAAGSAACSEPLLEPFAIAAATLARVRADSGGKGEKRGATARLLGQPRAEGGDNDARLFAEARFKRLIRTRDDWPGLMSQARRIAAILERKAPIGDLGASLILWNADPRVIRDWAFHYYQQEYRDADDEDQPQPAPAAAHA